MSDYKPEVGHRVRVIHTLEGVLTDVANERYFNIREDGKAGETYTSLIGGSVSVERLPDPETEWQAGDVVADANDITWAYRRVGDGNDDWFSLSGWYWGSPVRPLTHLIRNGKPVSA